MCNVHRLGSIALLVVTQRHASPISRHADGESALAVYAMGPEQLWRPSTKITRFNAGAWVISNLDLVFITMLVATVEPTDLSDH